MREWGLKRQPNICVCFLEWINGRGGRVEGLIFYVVCVLFCNAKWRLLFFPKVCATLFILKIFNLVRFNVIDLLGVKVCHLSITVY